MASSVVGVITDLYGAIASQEKEVKEQKASIRFLREANETVDVEQLTGATMAQETEHLRTSQGILNDLYARLATAIESWSQLASGEKGPGQEEPWPQFPEPPSRQPAVDQQLQPAALKTKTAPSLSDPAIGTQMRYTEQWNDWLASTAIDNPSVTLDAYKPTPWWMRNREHYGLCHPSEQGQLENSARATHFGRECYAPTRSPAVTQHWSFDERVRTAQDKNKRFLSSALPTSPTSGPHLSYSRPARACSQDIYDDEQYDPNFWQKNLRPGNIWTDVPQYPIPEEETLSPHSAPWSQMTDPEPLPRVRELRVGGTDPSSYYGRTQRKDFRSFI